MLFAFNIIMDSGYCWVFRVTAVHHACLQKLKHMLFILCDNDKEDNILIAEDEEVL